MEYIVVNGRTPVGGLFFDSKDTCVKKREDFLIIVNSNEGEKIYRSKGDYVELI